MTTREAALEAACKAAQAFINGDVDYSAREVLSHVGFALAMKPDGSEPHECPPLPQDCPVCEVRELVHRLRQATAALAHSAQADGVIERSTALWLIQEATAAADFMEKRNG